MARSPANRTARTGEGQVVDISTPEETARAGLFAGERGTRMLLPLILHTAHADIVIAPDRVEVRPHAAAQPKKGNRHAR